MTRPLSSSPWLAPLQFPPARAVLGCVLLTLGSCVAARLDVDKVLASELEPPAQAAASFQSPAKLDRLASAARNSALEPPQSAPAFVEAARALFLAADVRIQRATLEWLEQRESLQLDELLRADEQLSEQLHAAVETLTREGLAMAESALQLAPEDSGALTYRALHTALLTWAVGTTRALFKGLGPRCKSTSAAAVAADESFEGAAPLRLRGRFLSLAPWPLGDKRQGLELLQRATQLAPVTLNWLFLGDALWASGDPQAARSAWEQVAQAASDGASAALAGYHREFARRRLELSREGN